MTYSLATIESKAVGSIDTFATEAYRVPMLTEEEERDLAIRWHEQGDLDAAKKLVLSHVRFVVRIARGYLGYGLPVADLIQEGNIGLMKAVKRFDPSLGVRLASFAVHWIKAEMHEFIIRNWRIVRVATTKAQRKLFFNLRRMKQRLGWLGDAEIKGVAEELGVTTRDVLEMEARLNAHDCGLEISHDDEDLPQSLPLLDNEGLHRDFEPTLIANPLQQLEQDNWDSHQHEALNTVLASLSPREQDIILMRHLSEKKATLSELSEKYKVSIERIRQIEQQALKKMELALPEFASA